MPVDAVLLALHGAMLAEGYPDCEGDLLQAVRALVGPTEIPLGALLDLHCNLSPGDGGFRRGADRLQGVSAHRLRAAWRRAARPA